MTDWYVRKGGSDANGGSSASLTPERSGSDMTVNSGSTTATSASGNFTQDDVGKGINISSYDHGNNVLYKIAAVNSSTSITLERGYYGSGTSTNRIWAIGGALATVSKLFNTSALSSQFATPLQAGDSIFVGAGVYRETIGFNSTTTPNGSSGSPISIRGDVDGTITGDAGEVRITAYTTNDKTAPATSSALATSSKNYWNFENLVFVTGSRASGRMVNAGSSNNLTFTNCAFIEVGGGTTSTFTLTHTVVNTDPANITYDRCLFRLFGSAIQFSAAKNTTANYEAGVLIKNCVFDIGGTAFSITSSGSGTFYSGGYDILNCTIRSATGISIPATSVDLSNPVVVENCFISGTSNALAGGTVGQLVENNNLLVGPSTASGVRSNVNVGTGSISDNSYAALVYYGQEDIWGGMNRTYMSPTIDSPLYAFGASSNYRTQDFKNVPRPPNTALHTVGAIERRNCWVMDSTVFHSGVHSIRCDGAGYQDFEVPVEASPTTVTVWMRHSGQTNKPRFYVVNGTQAGVSDAYVEMTAAADTWEQLTMTFTPARRGIVTVRVISRDSGQAWADDFEVD